MDNPGFIPVFREESERWAKAHTNADCAWRALHKGGAYEFIVGGSPVAGFDVGIEVHDYGLFPLVAGRPLGWGWDIATPVWSVAQMTSQALSLVRALMCEDCRLRTNYAGDKPYDWNIEANSPAGWTGVDVVPLGFWRRWRLSRRDDLSERVSQNRVLAPVGFAAGTETWQHFVHDRHEG